MTDLLRRRRLLLLGIAPLGLPLAGCGTLGLPSQLTLSQAELDERLARRFPRTQRLLEVLDLTLSAPHVVMLPAQGRLACDFALQLRERLFDTSHAGRVGFDTALRWEPQDATLRLSQVNVQHLELDTLPRTLGASSQRLGRLLAEQLLEGLVLWQMPEAQRQRLQRAGLGVGPINVTEQGLVVQFTPAAPR
jgi:hypothetical protein